MGCAVPRTGGAGIPGPGAAVINKGRECHCSVKKGLGAPMRTDTLLPAQRYREGGPSAPRLSLLSYLAAFPDTIRDHW
ncbi:uncharacterized protein GJ701_005323 isoform 1-T1 [Geothlypis trichas]